MSEICQNPACTMSANAKRSMRPLLQHYMNLRGKRCERGGIWDAVVITTIDTVQREAFQQQIEDKEQRRELPLNLPIHIVADPPGPRIGNGGSTLVALEFLHNQYGEALFRMKILLVHAGGWSQRMPSASLLGKIFAAIPHGAPILQMLDVKIAGYLPLLPRLPPGVLLVCADDFVVYDLGDDCQDWAIPAMGVTALAHPSPLEVGCTHGVYVVQDADSINTRTPVVIAQCLEVLQKPSDQRMRDRCALLKSPTGVLEFADNICIKGDCVYTDSCFFMGVDVVQRLLGLKKVLGDIHCEIDAYGDFLQALGPQATDDYVHNTSNISQVTEDTIQVRREVYAAIHGLDIHLLLMNASQFVHIGTTGELIQAFCQDTAFRQQLALDRDAFNCWLPAFESSADGEGDGGSGRSSGCVMHSVLRRPSCLASACIVEYCHFDVPVTVPHNTIVSNCQWVSTDLSSAIHTDNSNLLLPSETFLHTAAVTFEGSSFFVTVFFHVADNLKKSAATSSLSFLPFLGSSVGTALKYWELAEEQVIPHVSMAPQDKGIVNLWTLRLFPACLSMTQSLLIALDMVCSVREGRSLSFTLRPSPSTRFFSLEEVMKHKDLTTMLNFRHSLFDLIMANMQMSQ